VLRFPEQDAIGIWFDADRKGIMNHELLRQWADCYDKNDTVSRIICHGRHGMEKSWEMMVEDMEKAGIAVEKATDCCERLCYCLYEGERVIGM
jgi:hypothetical protein